MGTRFSLLASELVWDKLQLDYCVAMDHAYI